MNNSEQFNKIIKTTDYNFHDSLLNEMNFRFEEATLKLIIEHVRFDDEKKSNLVYLGIFTFYKVNKFQVTGFFCDEDGFFTDEITSFNLENNDNFKIISTAGGVIEFIAESFSFEEEFVKEVKYG